MLAEGILAEARQQGITLAALIAAVGISGGLMWIVDAQGALIMEVGGWAAPFGIALVVIVIFWLLSKLFKFFVRKTLENRSYTRQNLVLVLNRVGSTFIIFFGVICI